jgi:hypothetical protein
MDLAQQRIALQFKLSTLLNYEEAAGLRESPRVQEKESSRRTITQPLYEARIVVGTRFFFLSL